MRTQNLTSALILTLAAAAAPLAAQKAQDAKKAATVPVVRLAGLYMDQPQAPMGLGALLSGSVKPKSFYKMLKTLSALAKDDSKDIVLDLSQPAVINMPQMSELQRAIGKLRAAGKRCHAYLENASSSQVQLAAMCDRILMADMGVLDMPSVAMSVMFMKDAMDMLGVKMDVVRCGDFKGAVEPFVLSKMSDHLRQHYRDMIEAMNKDLVGRIAKGRKLTVDQVRKLQQRRIFTALQAREAGLVDELVPWIGAKPAFKRSQKKPELEFRDVLKKGKKRQTMNFFQLMTALMKPPTKAGSEKGLVVLHLTGAISDGVKESPGSIISGPTVKLIQSVAKNDKVKAVVIRINSPGGSATASEAILLALEDLSRKKPVVTSMGELAASGGYYITCFGRPILAERGTITGSIGVFGMKPNVGPLMQKLGLNEELVALDDGPSMAALNRDWTPNQKARIQTMVNGVYDRFVGHVQSSRRLSREAVLKIAGGRVWSGDQAVANKLVDRIGGLQDAMALVAKEANLKPGYEVSHLPKPKDPIQMLVEELTQVRMMLPEAAQRVLARRSSSLDRALHILVDTIRSKHPARSWAMLPEVLEIR